MTTIHWPAVVEHAATIVRSYDTPVTLRQLFYRLIADGTLQNTEVAYKTLSDRTAKARRSGNFPDLADHGRGIERYKTFTGVDDALAWLHDGYRRDRTEGQPWSIYLIVEKHGLVAQLQSWFGDLGLPILALGGFSSQTLVDEVREDVERQGRPAVLLYAGDFDPSGEDIDRDFVARSRCFDKVIRVALNPEQIAEYDLPANYSSEKVKEDSRNDGFKARHGFFVQVEMDALRPEDLEALYRIAITEVWDVSAYEASLEQERAERDLL